MHFGVIFPEPSRPWNDLVEFGAFCVSSFGLKLPGFFWATPITLLVGGLAGVQVPGFIGKRDAWVNVGLTTPLGCNAFIGLATAGWDVTGPSAAANPRGMAGRTLLVNTGTILFVLHELESTAGFWGRSETGLLCKGFGATCCLAALPVLAIFADRESRSLLAEFCCDDVITRFGIKPSTICDKTSH